MTAFDPVSVNQSLPDDVSIEVQTATRPGHQLRLESDPRFPSYYRPKPYRYGASALRLRPIIGSIPEDALLR